MNKGLYFRLAKQNIKKNSTIFIPFILSGIMMTMLFFMGENLYILTGKETFKGSTSLHVILTIGIYVTAFFSVIVQIYTNKFLMKQRVKEHGLYSMLGMEKKHIALVTFWETCIAGVISIAGGLSFGVLFSRLLYMFLNRIVNMDKSFRFSVATDAVVKTLCLFVGIYLLMIVMNFIRIARLNPLEFMKSSHVGEQEPKARWLLAIIGFAFLGYGYYLTLITKNPIQTITFFFLAVICVVIGTYLLFMAGSIAILKLLKKNKKFYYNKKHFISVSGMVYRMRQNALGLANICILSTAFLVVLSSTVSLYLGINKVIESEFPRDMAVSFEYCADPTCVEEHKYNYDDVEALLEKRAKDNNLNYGNVIHGYSFMDDVNMNGASFTSMDLDDIASLDDYRELHFCTRDYYESLEQPMEALGENQVYLDENLKDKITGNIFEYDGHRYEIAGYVPTTSTATNNWNLSYGSIVILPNLDELKMVGEICNEYLDQEYYRFPLYTISFDLKGDEKNIDAYNENLREAICKTGVSHLSIITNRYEEVPEIRAIYGGLFFVGIFVGILFLFTTVMIIYYKQVSEGYEDRNRFQILEKVGLSKQEMKSVIRSQILQVFFLPLVVAGIHLCFAFKILKDMLSMLGTNNTILYVRCTLGSVLSFAVVYFLVYSLTAKVYYRITMQK